jgi:hypothetical protein
MTTLLATTPDNATLVAMTTTIACKLHVEYAAAYLYELGNARAAVLPTEVWRLADGRILACYGSRDVVFESSTQFGKVHPLVVQPRELAERAQVGAPPLLETFACSVDWAAVHTAMRLLDDARVAGIGLIPGGGDVLGGTYCSVHYRTLADLVKLVSKTAAIASDAWNAVHGASKKGADGVEVARQACRVAIACSRVFELLHRAGLIDDSQSRICGSCEGYGLTGLRWLAGEQSDEGCTSAEVEAFAAGGPLPGR